MAHRARLFGYERVEATDTISSCEDCQFTEGRLSTASKVGGSMKHAAATCYAE